MSDPQLSVVIACHTERRWDDLLRAIGSVQEQTLPAHELVVAVDHCPELQQRLVEALPELTVVANTGPKGASATRNAGALVTTGDFLAFLDDDAVASPTWLADLAGAFTDARVAGVGGFVAPLWESRAPRWLPPEMLWAVGATYEGTPEAGGWVRNVWGENLAVRRELFEAVGGFRVGFGKRDAINRPEDTDLCIRIALAGGQWWYTPAARVDHLVPAERTTLRFFLRRCLNEGRGKAQLAALLRDADIQTLATERDFVLHVLPRGLRRELASARQDPWGMVRASVIILAACLAGAGLLYERLVHP